MSVSTKRRPALHRAQPPAPFADTATPAVAKDAPVSLNPAYRGDLCSLSIWFGGAMILAALHIIDAVCRWFRR